MALRNDYIEIAHHRAVEKKTHVSFPQLKYPSLRDEGLRDPVQWLTGKAMDDGAEGLWRVHDGLYDLTDFVQKHPGGAEWLELTKGTDITEAFEAHHITRYAETLLKNFYIKDANTPRNSPFTFKDDGFYKTLKNDVREILQKVPKQTANASNMIIDGLFATYLITSALSCWATNYWIVNISYLIASLTLAWTVVASHNYIHRKTNWRMYLFNLSLWSYRDFRVSHALSHHLYPNTLMDLEVSAFEPLVWWNPRKNVPRTYVLAFLIELIVFPFLFLLNFIKRLSCNFIRPGFFQKHYRWHDGVGFMIPIWIYLISGCSFYHAMYMWFWILCTGSFIFFIIGSNAAHHHPDIFKDGDEVSDIHLDWGTHEVSTLMDRTDINGSLFRVMTFFGDHTLHHLFPTLDHAYLPYIYPKFLQRCEEFKANFRMVSSFNLFVGQIKMTLKTEPKLLEN